MTQQLLKSRLLMSGQCAPEQMQPDFEAQFEEIKAIVLSVLYSESGCLAIAQSLDEALGLFEECLRLRKNAESQALRPDFLFWIRFRSAQVTEKYREFCSK